MTGTLEIEKENLRVRAYGVIRKALMSGRFQPGQKLLLRSMADEIGISITPVREALLQLVSERALVSDSSRSLFVPNLDIERFREIRELRIELEGRLADAAAKKATPADLKELEGLHRAMVEHRRAGEPREALVMNEAFHFKIYRMAKMPVLYDIVEGLWVQIGPILTRLYVRVDGKNAVNHPHLGMIAALKRNDGSAARLAIANDIIWASQSLEETLAEDASSEAGDSESVKTPKPRASAKRKPVSPKKPAKRKLLA